MRDLDLVDIGVSALLALSSHSRAQARSADGLWLDGHEDTVPAIAKHTSKRLFRV